MTLCWSAPTKPSLCLFTFFSPLFVMYFYCACLFLMTYKTSWTLAKNTSYICFYRIMNVTCETDFSSSKGLDLLQQLKKSRLCSGIECQNKEKLETLHPCHCLASVKGTTNLCKTKAMELLKYKIALQRSHLTGKPFS